MDKTTKPILTTEETTSNLIDENEEFDLDTHMEKYSISKQFPEFDGWEEIGFTRPLASELWEVFLELIGNTLYILVVIYLVPIVAPFPISNTYRGWGVGLFGTVFMVFDTGTNFNLSRFIAEYRTKDPRKMMEYVGFFIKYQMWTGLVQVTLISWFVFEFVTSGNYVFLIWIILLNLHKQYPGMLNIFEQVLTGIQHFQYVQIANWIQKEGFDFLFNIGILVYARHYGEIHPEVGMIMAFAIFGTFSKIIDDFIFLFVDAWYLNKVFKKYMGFSLKDALNFKVGKDVYRNVVIFAIPGSIIPSIAGIITTWMFFFTTGEIAGIAAFTALIGIATGFAGIMRQFGMFHLSTNLAESYMSGKTKLADFYISTALKWHYYFKILLGMAVFAVIPYFQTMIDVTEGLENYEGAIYFLPFAIIKKLVEPFFALPNQIMIAAKKLNQQRIWALAYLILNPLNAWLLIRVFAVHEMGMLGIVYFLMFSSWIPQMIVEGLKYRWVRKNIMRIKVYGVTTFLIPLVSALPAIFFSYGIYYTLFPLMLNSSLGFVGSQMILYPSFFFILIFTYPPLTVILGAFDDYQLFILKKAIEISGPSKFIFRRLFWLITICAKIARKMGTHGRYGIPYDEAHKEIIELMEMKKIEKAKMLEKRTIF